MGTPPDASAAPAIASTAQGRPGAKNWWAWARLDYPFPGCSAARPCFNGDCVDGNCVCDIGWRGPECSQLDLLPAKRSAPGVPMDGAHPTWGGTAVWEDGRWHLIVGGKYIDGLVESSSGWPRRYWRVEAPPTADIPDPMTRWGRSPPYDATREDGGWGPYNGSYPWTMRDAYGKVPNSGEGGIPDLYEPKKSYLTRYESAGDDPAGPYVEKEIIGTGFRSDMKRHPQTGELLLLTTGFRILRAASVKGPWTDAGRVYDKEANGHGLDPSQWDCDMKDPSFVIHKNGTTVISYRGTRCDATTSGDHTEQMALLKADSWNGTYVRQNKWIFGPGSNNEDSYMWIDDRGTHMIMHSQLRDLGPQLLLPEDGQHHKKKRGGYAFSADGVDHWQLSLYDLWPGEIAWDDGSTTFLLKQQRPSLIFGLDGRPSHLATGVDFVFYPCCDWYLYGSGWTLVQPLVTACPTGEVPDAAGTCAKCQAAASSPSARTAISATTALPVRLNRAATRSKPAWGASRLQIRKSLTTLLRCGQRSRRRSRPSR